MVKYWWIDSPSNSGDEVQVLI